MTAGSGYCRKLGRVLGFGWMLGTMGWAAAATPPAPFALERAIIMKEVPPGPYSDYLSVDLPGKRLFATPQAAKSVAVLSLESGQVLRMIKGFGNTHGIYYNSAQRRLFVADSGSGDVKVFEADQFTLVKRIPLAKGADWLTHDEEGHFLFVNDGGEDADMDHAEVSIVDTSTLEKVASVPVRTAALEASGYDAQAGRLYVNAPDQHAVAVIDLSKRQVIAMWPLGAAHQNMTVTIDRSNNRLYIGCRDSPMQGSIVVLDRQDGKVLKTLPIGGWVDATHLDEKRHAIYASTGVGHLETYAIKGQDTYVRLTPVDTAVMAKTSLFSAELDRLFVSVPHLGSLPAQVMVFRPTDPLR